MEHRNYKSTLLRSPPFRATQLWNEAVTTLQREMPTRRHFYRMRYYDNCFSGKEAVDWLTKTLLKNPRFGKNVTTEGTRKLLQHFLKTGVFQSVKGTLTFKESGLYEFLDRTVSSPSRKQDHKQLFSHKALKEIDSNVLKEQRSHPNYEEGARNHHQFLSSSTENKNHNEVHNYRGGPSAKDVSWKDSIFRRIEGLVPTMRVELLVDPSTVQSDWIMYNICPEFDNIRKKTELPFWVFTAISSVVRPQEKESEYTTYDGFEKDVYTVVRDYLRHRSSPMIPYCLYELFMYTFNHLHYSDLEMKNRSQQCDSVENLVLSMSCEWNDDLLVDTDNLTRTVLPPNSCFETAFTSDEPITRIVPQSSVDTICLFSNKSIKNPTGSDLISKSKTNILRNYNEAATFDACFEKLPSKFIEKPVGTKYKNRKRTNHLRRTQSVAQIDSAAKWNTLTVCKRSSESQQQSYVNYGLSQSMDDLLAVDDNMGLDFEAAMQSVNCLMRASCGPPTSSTSSSRDSLNSCHITKNSLIGFDWHERTRDTATLVLQSVLMLMSPASRTSLQMLLQFINQLPENLNSSLTQTEVVYDLSAHILSPGPHSKNVYSHHMVVSAVYFLVDNYQRVFEDLPFNELLRIKEEKLQENQQIQEKKVFCEQLTRRQFEDQGVNSSWLALAELLEQIINDKKMKSKEKKKRLKKFKEAYPHIYKQRFGGSFSNLAGLVHFR